MNPYDFVPIDWNNPPERHRPLPHDRFSGISGKDRRDYHSRDTHFHFLLTKKERWIGGTIYQERSGTAHHPWQFAQRAFP